MSHQGCGFPRGALAGDRTTTRTYVGQSPSRPLLAKDARNWAPHSLFSMGYFIEVEPRRGPPADPLQLGLTIATYEPLW